MRKTYWRIGKVVLVWSVCGMLTIDSAFACRWLSARRSRSCAPVCYPVMPACDGDVKALPAPEPMVDPVPEPEPEPTPPKPEPAPQPVAFQPGGNVRRGRMP